MSKEFSTVIALGAKAPFILVMQLTKHERTAFIESVTPNMSAALKHPLLG
ncbi:MAG: hypothetical protein ACJAT7_002755 [Psychromonas sp.]|jgi:hypothetical protein